MVTKVKRILLVDGTTAGSSGLRRGLAELTEWEVTFAATDAEALALIGQYSFDVVVTDAQVPALGGANLLQRVRSESPLTVRFMLSADPGDDPAHTFEVAHQYLARTCDVQSLMTAINRAQMLQTTVENPSLRQLVAGINMLPSLPASYTEIISALDAPDASMGHIGELIAGDMAIAAKVLQLVNSAYFGLRQQVVDLQQAVVLLGLDTVRALVHAVTLFSLVENEETEGMLEELYAHAIAVGRRAGRIARTLGYDRDTIGQAMLGGMLHDIGKLIFCTYLPQDYFPTVHLARKARQPLYLAEQQIFGTSHAEVGAYLLGLWGFHEQILVGVGFHHEPSRFSEVDCPILSAIHLANVQCHLEEAGVTDPTSLCAYDEAYLERIGGLEEVLG